MKITKRMCMNQLGLTNDKANRMMYVQRHFALVLNKDMDEEELVIDGRTLWSLFDSHIQFATWMRGMIKNNNLKEKEDYIEFKKSIKKGNNFTNTIEYLLSIKVAKKLCIIENKDFYDYTLLFDNAGEIKNELQKAESKVDSIGSIEDVMRVKKKIDLLLKEIKEFKKNLANSGLSVKECNKLAEKSFHNKILAINKK